MCKWKLQPQDNAHYHYYFSGRFYYSKLVSQKLHFKEVISIYQQVQDLVAQKKGIHYLQTFVHEETGEGIHFIDQLEFQVMSYDRDNDENYCLLLFEEELVREAALSRSTS